MFDATLRVYFDESADSSTLTKDLRTELQALDVEAKRLRTIGQNPIDELRPRVEQLRVGLARVRSETLDLRRSQIAKVKTEYDYQRAKRATVELMKQADAQSRIDSLDDSQIEALAMGYVNETEDLDLYELRQLQIRTRNTPDLEHFTDSIRQEMTARRADRPWLEGDAAKLADEIEEIEGTTPAHVAIVDGDQRFEILIDDLIDYSGELDTPE